MSARWIIFPDTHSFVVLPQSSMYDSAVEQYFRGVRNDVKRLQRFFEFVIVIMRQGLHPGLDFLKCGRVSQYIRAYWNTVYEPASMT